MSPTSSPSAAPSLGETSRRRLFALLGAGGAAGLATLLSRNDARAGHDGSNVMHLGVTNTNPASPTSLNAPTPGGQVLNVSGRTSFQATSQQHGAVFEFRNNRTEEFGSVILATTHSEGAAAVIGSSMSQSGEGLSLESVGVAGSSIDGIGVVGNSAGGTGVAGNSPSGIGVSGSTLQDNDDLPGTGIGVRASAQEMSGLGGPSTGTALQVLGRAAFTSVGSGVILAGQNSSGPIEDAHVTDACHISVSLASDPGEREVRWVERQAGGFRVHLTPAQAKKRPQTAFTYVILEPAEFDCC